MSVASSEPGEFNPNLLLGRRLEVFRPNLGVWIPGLIVKEVLVEDEEEEEEDDWNNSEDEHKFKWMVKLNNDETLWFDNLRGNSNVRFVGNLSVIAGYKPPVIEETNHLSLLYANYGRRRGAGPLYLEITESSVQPAYTNLEVERIHQSFRPSNYNTIKKLPHKLAPDAILNKSTKITKENVTLKNKPIPQHKSLKKNGLFHDFGYIPSPLDLEDKQTTNQRRANELKRANIAGGFDHEGVPYSAPFVGGSLAASTRMKHEANFPGREDKGPNSGVYPYMSHDFDAANDIMKQNKARASSFYIHNNSFTPTGTKFGGQRGTAGSALSEHPTKRLLPELLKMIHKTLVTDWPRSNFQVYSESDGVVYLRFESKTVDSMDALQEYMNTSATDNSSALDTSVWYTKYRLRKVVELWGSTTEQGYISYAFRPPWVKATATSSYHSLHPDTATFASSRSASGISSDFKPTSSYGPSLLKRMSTKSMIQRSASFDDDISGLAFT